MLTREHFLSEAAGFFTWAGVAPWRTAGVEADARKTGRNSCADSVVLEVFFLLVFLSQWEHSVSDEMSKRGGAYERRWLPGHGVGTRRFLFQRRLIPIGFLWPIAIGPQGRGGIVLSCDWAQLAICVTEPRPQELLQL
ncbi:hypothetical protein EYF80_057798 [Liparis tanakae]|uniref:Uncharacterized protein n=1 Tax=Liparis tanakae TaxID=230148 RepID=A0A4Z2EUW0_9TELE|nr:hypothetical protein EYF80_057798 [Liparis tanakae]